MSRFADVLRETAERLNLPQPTKSRILIEIAGDMEDFYGACRERGLSKEEAHREAVGHFQLSDEALADLVTVHTSRVRRFLDRLSEQGRSRAERVALLLVVVFVLTASGTEVAGTGLMGHAGPLAWPALLLAFGGIVLGIRKAWALWLTQDHDPRQLRDGLAVILAIACIDALIGFFGFWVEIQVLAQRLAAGAPGTNLIIWMRASSATVVVAMMSALICSLIWYLLAHKVARIEQAQVDYLLELA